MAELYTDQAAGLRRLFGREPTRVVTFAAGSVGVGKSLLVANLAAALARQGKEVLVLDENVSDNVASCYGALARHDLLQVIDGQKALAEVVLTVAPGVRVLPGAQAVQRLGTLNRAQQQSLVAAITGMERAADVILVDASLDHPLGFSPLGLAAHDTVVVVAASSAAITDAYALIKKVSLGYSHKRFRIVISKARGREEATAISRNIAELTRTRRLAELDYSGFVPLDENLRQAARLCQPVVALYPETPAAVAYRTIAGQLLAWPLPADEGGGIEQFVQQLLHLSQHIDPIAIYA